VTTGYLAVSDTAASEACWWVSSNTGFIFDDINDNENLVSLSRLFLFLFVVLP
jgi:hypothetical protein